MKSTSQVASQDLHAPHLHSLSLASKNLFRSESLLLNQNLESRHLLETHQAPTECAPEVFISIDEVGRGCIAGPVVAVATLWSTETDPVALNQPFHPFYSLLQAEVRDSKKISAQKRVSIFASIFEKSLFFGADHADQALHFRDLATPQLAHKWKETELLALEPSLEISPTNGQYFQFMGAAAGQANPSEIEALNIWGATQLALSRALKAVETQFEASLSLLNFWNHGQIFFDGSLISKVPRSFAGLPFHAVVKGDSHLKSIALSSIIAKVHRDSMLDALDKEIPGYSFNKHKGYGTALHMEAIRLKGITDAHRPSFLRNLTSKNCQTTEPH